MKWVKEDVRIVARVHMFQNRVIQENLPLIVLHVHMVRIIPRFTNRRLVILLMSMKDAPLQKFK